MQPASMNIARITIAFICTTLFWLPPGSSAHVVLLDQLTRSLVDTEAAKYRRAVNDLSSIETMSLKTEADFKRASSIIDDQIENLRFVKYRMIQLALSNNVFVGALQSELGKVNGNEDVLLRRFRQNHAALTSLNGTRATQQNIATELDRDFQRIKNASEHVRDAASSILNRRGSFHRAGMDQPLYVSAGYKAPPAIDDYFEALFAASTIVVGAVRSPATKLPSGGPAGGSSGGSGSSSSGSVWIQDVQQYHECARQAGEKQDRCKDSCGPGFFQWACLANCAASYMLSKAECAINSMHSY